MVEEVSAPLLEDVPAEEGARANGRASLASWGRGVLAPYAVSVATLAICFSCALPTADFTTDVGLALPRLLERGLLESFEVQLAGIAVGVLLGYMEFLRRYGLWQKLSVCPLWLRYMLMAGGLLAFPLAPLFVAMAALVGFATGDEALLAECGEAVPVVVAGEFFEAITSLTLQLKTYVFNSVDVRVSMVVGFLSSTKAALAFDLASRKYLVLTMSTGTGDAGVDHDLAIVTGLLPGVAADLGRSALLALHRAAEIASGASCTVSFHRMANDGLSVEVLKRQISMAGPVFYLAQVLLVVLQRGLRRRHFVVPLTVPLPLFDASFGSAAEHSTRACAQVVVAVLWATSHAHKKGWYEQVGKADERAGVVDETAWSACISAAGLSSALMWVTLAGIRALPATPLEEHGRRVAAECAELYARGAQLRNFAKLKDRRAWSHPCAVSFAHALLQRLVPGSFNHESRSLDLHGVEHADDELFRLVIHVSTLNSLQLDLRGKTITNDGLKAVMPPAISSLQLELDDNDSITDDGLMAAIPRHTLTSLQLGLARNDNVTNYGLKGAIPPALTSLRLGLSENTQITNDGLKAAIPRTITSLGLELTYNDNITDDGLKAAIPPTITSLQLELTYNDSITNDGLKAALAIPRTLTSLQLGLRGNSNITNDGLRGAIPPALTRLQLDGLRHNSEITAERLGGSPHLQIDVRDD